MDMNGCEKCNAFCCRNICLPYSYETLTEWHKNALQRQSENQGGKISLSDRSILELYPLLIFLRIEPMENVPKNVYVYTCKELDTEMNRCKIYDKRPMMCKNFPYGKQASKLYPNCTYRGTGIPISTGRPKKKLKLNKIE